MRLSAAALLMLALCSSTAGASLGDEAPRCKETSTCDPADAGNLKVFEGRENVETLSDHMQLLQTQVRSGGEPDAVAQFHTNKRLHCNWNGCLEGVFEWDVYKAEAMCKKLIPQTAQTVCTGGELSEELFDQGQAQPLKCLQENRATFHMKLCQLCSQLDMDGVVSPSFDRNGTFCDGRFKMQRHLNELMDHRGSDVLDAIHKTIPHFDSYVKKYSNYSDMLQHEDWQSTVDPETAAIIDMDLDGAVSEAEYREYLNVLVLMGDMMPAPMPEKDYVKDYEGFHRWASEVNDAKFEWMHFFG